MYSLNVNTRPYSYYNTVKAGNNISIDKNKDENKQPQRVYVSNPDKPLYTPVFTASRFRTELSSKDEKNKYNELTKLADKDTKKQLNALLKSGILLNSSSNDNSTTLDNLYKIATTPRAQGLNNAVMLRDTVNTLADPYTITQ